MDSSLRVPLLVFLCALSIAISPRSDAATTGAYPSVPGAGSDDCSLAGGDGILIPPRREVHGNGRIFDISHKYVRDMPVFESKDGLGHFLWLQKSMKNGSRANNSEMKIPTHTGTHVDAPGHVIDRYFDAGFDVDTLDLEVLNGK